MKAIESAINTGSRSYRENFSAMQDLIDDLNRELKKTREDRSDRARKRNAELGKLTAIKRLDMLRDKKSPWLELCPLAARGMYDGRIHGAGGFSGIGMIHGREVLISVNDPMIKGGAVYPLGVKKSLRIQTICMENRLPTVVMVDSGGAYLPLQSQMFPDIDGGGRVFYNQALMSKMNIPQITAVTGLCTAGAAYKPAMSDHVIHVNRTGAIFLGGPPLVKAATGEDVTAEELGGAMVHCRESGVSDYFAEDDTHAVQIIRDIVNNLPKSAKAEIPRRAPADPLYDPREIYGVVPKDVSSPYDCREVIARLVDGSEFEEFKELYGPTIVCGWAYIHGYQVGILGNNGLLLSESCLKAAQFVQLCDRQGIPLVFLQNISGYNVGKAYERRGIVKHGQKMINAVATATVPKFTVIVGASFGSGNYCMCGRAFSPRFLWMWPNARIGAMDGGLAAEIMISIKNDQLAREEKPPLSNELAEEIRKPIIERAGTECTAYYSTANLWDDGIIDPAETRDVLGMAVSVSLNAPLEGRNQGHGTFRM